MHRTQQRLCRRPVPRPNPADPRTPVHEYRRAVHTFSVGGPNARGSRGPAAGSGVAPRSERAPACGETRRWLWRVATLPARFRPLPTASDRFRPPRPGPTASARRARVRPPPAPPLCEHRAVPASATTSPIPVLYFTDILCVWAYAGQIRIDRLLAQEGRTIALEHRFCPIFGDARAALTRRWGDRGGLPAYAAHVRSVCDGFDHLSCSDRVWLDVAPRSSLSAHLVLAAVRHLEAGGTAPEGAFATACWRFRRAFFEEARDISVRRIQLELAEELDIATGAVEQCLDSGAAHAELTADFERARDLDVRKSPTILLNEGRQRLTGNVGFRIIAANVREVLRHPGIDDASWC